jgi:hypothetical protein
MQHCAAMILLFSILSVKRGSVLSYWGMTLILFGKKGGKPVKAELRQKIVLAPKNCYPNIRLFQPIHSLPLPNPIEHQLQIQRDQYT